MNYDAILNDLHIPYQDDKSLKPLFRFLYHLQPERLFLNGDILDCYEISSFDKNPLNTHTFRDELKTAIDYLDYLNFILPSTKKYYIVGNHEFRLHKYIVRNAPALTGLIDLERELKLKEMNYKVINNDLREQYIEPKEYPILIGHFNKVSKHSGYTAKALVEMYGKSIIQGHIHRLGIHYKRIHGQQLIGIENGCLCKLNPGYVMHPNWQQGFTIIGYKDGEYYPQLIEIKNHKFMYCGRIYQ